MANKHPLLQSLAQLNQTSMAAMLTDLDSSTVTELHNLISKTNVLRALITLALQDKKFPIPK